MEIDSNQVVQEDVQDVCSRPLPWLKLRNKSILVTGAGGFLASYIVKTLLKASNIYDLNLNVICVTRSDVRHSARLRSCTGFENFTSYIQDMGSALRCDFPKADILIHAASQATPRLYGSDPVGTLAPNVVGTNNLLERTREFEIDQFLFVSSGEVYGTQPISHTEINEDQFGTLNPMNVRSCYAESKRMAENICASYHHQYGTDVRIVRPFHTYGPGLTASDGRVFADFIHSAAKGETIKMRSDGKARRPFCYITDALTGIFSVLFMGSAGEAYNIANPEQEVSIADLATIVATTRSDVKLQVETLPALDGYLQSPISRQVVNVDKLRSLGWYPTVDINDGFSRSVRAELLDRC